MAEPPPGIDPPFGPITEVSEAESRFRARRAFGVWLAGGAAGAAGLYWLKRGPADGGIPRPLRAAHEANAELGQAAFGPARRSREFPPGEATEPKVNGTFGRPAAAGEGSVRVEVPGAAPREFTPAELVAGLERVEQTVEHKCIEGWSAVVTWGGVRFADLATKLGIDAARFPYVAALTADGAYYVGLDTASAMHPQTLVCDRMNGEPLPADHGGPLRLVLSVKYGIKSLKWLAALRLQSERPADYWAERGYDWYSGL